MRDIDELGLVKVSVRLEVPVIRIVDGANEAASVNGPGLFTVSVAVAVLLIPPYKELTELLAVNVPAVVPLT